MTPDARDPGAAGGSRAPEPVATARAPRLWWAALAALLAVVVVPGILSALRLRPDPLPVLGVVPPFALTSDGGATVTRDSLAGRVWVADFIFTRCSGICPLLSQRMSGVQRALRGRDDVRLVSISVDPQHDSSEVLSAYAKGYGADPSTWIFLTGDWEEVRRLVGEGFRLAVSRAEPGSVPEGELVTHSDRMVLVDRQGRIRGTYHGTEEAGVAALLADLDRLSAER